VKTFVENFLSCTSEKCTRTYLRSFENLRHEKLVKPVLNKVCTSNFQHDEQALKFLQKMPPKSWVSDEVWRSSFTRWFLETNSCDQVLHKLKLLLKNFCPKPVDQTARMMAGYFLLTLTPPSNVSNLVFDIFDNLDGYHKSSNEIRSYLLNLVQQLAEERPYFKYIIFGEFLLSFRCWKILVSQGNCGKNEKKEVIQRMEPVFRWWIVKMCNQGGWL